MNIIIIFKLDKSQRFRNNFYQAEAPPPSLLTNKQENEYISMEDIRTLPKNEEEDSPEHENQSNNNGYVFSKIRNFILIHSVTSKFLLDSEQSSRQKSGDKGLSAILLCMSALFIICQSLKLIPDLYELLVCHLTLDTIGHHCDMDGWVGFENLILKFSVKVLLKFFHFSGSTELCDCLICPAA